MKTRQRIAAVLMALVLTSLAVAAPAARCRADALSEAVQSSKTHLALVDAGELKRGRGHLIVGSAFLLAGLGAMNAWMIARATLDPCTKGYYGTCIAREEVSLGAKVGLGVGGAVAAGVGLSFLIKGMRLRRHALIDARVSFGPHGVLLGGKF